MRFRARHVHKTNRRKEESSQRRLLTTRKVHIVRLSYTHLRFSTTTVLYSAKQSEHHNCENQCTIVSNTFQNAFVVKQCEFQEFLWIFFKHTIPPLSYKLSHCLSHPQSYTAVKLNTQLVCDDTKISVCAELPSRNDFQFVFIFLPHKGKKTSYTWPRILVCDPVWFTIAYYLV